MVMVGNVLLFVFGLVVVSAIIELGKGIINQVHTIKYLKSTNIAKLSKFKRDIKSQILDLFKEIKQPKFNRETCLQDFPGSKKNKLKLFNITEEVTIDEPEYYSFQEFNILFLII